MTTYIYFSEKYIQFIFDFLSWLYCHNTVLILAFLNVFLWTFMKTDTQAEIVISQLNSLPLLFLPDKAGDIDMSERGHQVLTIKAVHDASVAGDGAGKVLRKRREEGVRQYKLPQIKV